MTPRLTKSQMVSECNNLYRKLLFIHSGQEERPVLFYDISETFHIDEVRVVYERYMFVKEDIIAMENCLRKQINKRITEAVNGLCRDYRLARPASVEFRINGANRTINGLR